MSQSLETLVDQVNAWCDEHQVRPANGQAATALSVRTLRYYRTMNLLDAPSSGGGSGYGQRHYLQACAVRVLQAQGLPISRIQSLLFGRNDEELQQILDAEEGGSATLPESSRFLQPETWRTWPLTGDVMLVSRGAELQLTPEQISALQQILNIKQPQPQPAANQS